jgi:hypothetical protein
MDSFLSLLVGLIVGLLFFFWDKKNGIKWYRRWHNLSHKNPLSQGSDLTFITNQPFSKRIVPAILLTAVFGYITWMFGHTNLIYTILTFTLMFVGVVAGFYIGPFLGKTVPEKIKDANQALEKSDKLESEIKDDLKVAKDKVLDKAPNASTQEEEETPPKAEGDNNNDKDWRKGVKDFLDK